MLSIWIWLPISDFVLMIIGLVMVMIQGLDLVLMQEFGLYR